MCRQAWKPWVSGKTMPSTSLRKLFKIPRGITLATCMLGIGEDSKGEGEWKMERAELVDEAGDNKKSFVFYCASQEITGNLLMRRLHC
jgi:hypothetical protein